MLQTNLKNVQLFQGKFRAAVPTAGMAVRRSVRTTSVEGGQFDGRRGLPDCVLRSSRAGRLRRLPDCGCRAARTGRKIAGFRILQVPASLETGVQGAARIVSGVKGAASLVAGLHGAARMWPACRPPPLLWPTCRSAAAEGLPQR